MRKRRGYLLGKFRFALGIVESRELSIISPSFLFFSLLSPFLFLWNVLSTKTDALRCSFSPKYASSARTSNRLLEKLLLAFSSGTRRCCLGKCEFLESNMIKREFVISSDLQVFVPLILLIALFHLLKYCFRHALQLDQLAKISRISQTSYYFWVFDICSSKPACTKWIHSFRCIYTQSIYCLREHEHIASVCETFLLSIDARNSWNETYISNMTHIRI